MTDLSICEVCGARPAIGVFSTSIPYSAAYCRECVEAGVDPYWVIVSNTACVGGLAQANEWWEGQVTRTLEHLGRSREQFDVEVAEAIKQMEEYEP